VFFPGQAFVRSLPKHSLVADLGCGALAARAVLTRSEEELL
jgi:hypothetical protein